MPVNQPIGVLTFASRQAGSSVVCQRWRKASSRFASRPLPSHQLLPSCRLPQPYMQAPTFKRGSRPIINVVQKPPHELPAMPMRSLSTSGRDSRYETALSSATAPW